MQVACSMLWWTRSAIGQACVPVPVAQGYPTAGPLEALPHELRVPLDTATGQATRTCHAKVRGAPPMVTIPHLPRETHAQQRQNARFTARRNIHTYARVNSAEASSRTTVSEHSSCLKVLAGGHAGTLDSSSMDTHLLEPCARSRPSSAFPAPRPADKKAGWNSSRRPSPCSSLPALPTSSPVSAPHPPSSLLGE